MRKPEFVCTDTGKPAQPCWREGCVFKARDEKNFCCDFCRKRRGAEHGEGCTRAPYAKFDVYKRDLQQRKDEANRILASMEAVEQGREPTSAPRDDTRPVLQRRRSGESNHDAEVSRRLAEAQHRADKYKRKWKGLRDVMVLWGYDLSGASSDEDDRVTLAEERSRMKARLFK